jgi:hypothetical protein
MAACDVDAVTQEIMTMRRSIRATPAERLASLPGDALIADSIGSITHAITIERPASEVWPWLAQMGAGSRAGWYSYDFLDNGRQPSARRVVPDLQSIGVGTLFPAIPGTTDGFHVLGLDAGRHLVLGMRPRAGVPPIVTWAFVLDGRDRARTRLVVRVRAARGYPVFGLPSWIGLPIVRLLHFVMERKQLLGIATRVDAASPRARERLDGLRRATPRGHD